MSRWNELRLLNQKSLTAHVRRWPSLPHTIPLPMCLVFNVMFYPFSLLFYCWCSLRVFALKKKARRTKKEENSDVTTILGKNTFEYRLRLNFTEIKRSTDRILFEKVSGVIDKVNESCDSCSCFRRWGSTCNSPITRNRTVGEMMDELCVVFCLHSSLSQAWEGKTHKAFKLF